MVASALDLTLLVDLGLILVLATVFSYLARALKQPSLIAYIAAGLVLGPLGLGAMGITFGGVPLGVTNVQDVMILSELGVAFLLFGVGIESNFSKLRELGKVVLVGGVVQVLVTALVVFLAAYQLGLVGFEQAVYIGLIVAFSSTVIVVKILSDSHQISTLHGRLLIGFLVVQDMLVILAMPLLANLGELLSPAAVLPIFMQGVLIIGIAYLLNRYAYPKIFGFATKSEELLSLVAVSSCFVFIVIAYLLNFSIAVGAFIAGLSISTLPYNLEVYNKIRGLRDFLATIFFVTLGMQISLDFVSVPLALVLLVVGAVFFLKPALIYLISLFSGFGSKVSLVVALALAQVSEFSFILLSEGRDVLGVTPGLYSFLLLVIAVSMVITPYVMANTAGINALFSRVFGTAAVPLKRKAFYRRISMLETIPEGLRNHIVIVGGGTMGLSLATALKGSDERVIVVDHDSEKVFKCMKECINAVYGSAENTEVMRRVNLAEAKLLVLAMPDVRATNFLITHAKKINPSLVVFARAHFASDALDFYGRGADFVVMPHIIGSNIFLREVGNFLDKGRVSYITNYKDEYLKYLKEELEGRGVAPICPPDETRKAAPELFPKEE
ncbi:MAG: cation:proton antiporter [Candidatus Diapherotrites archaeon]